MAIRSVRAWWSVAASAALCAAMTAAAEPPKAAPKPTTAKAPVKPAATKPAQSDALAERVKQIIAAGDKPELVEANRKQLDELWAWAIARQPLDAAEGWIALAQERRVQMIVEGAAAGERAEVLALLRSSPRLCTELAFLFDPSVDVPSGVRSVLLSLKAKSGADLESHAALAAAMCVVRDEPLSVTLNENSVKAADPAEVFAWFVRNEGAMEWGLKDVPAELLVFVVDVCAPTADLDWALNACATNRAIGPKYNDVAYDYDALKKGTTKAITVHGVSLPNLRKLGGVCIDQAYYSSSLAKAMGVPSVIITGATADMGHAWLGFLEARGGQVEWNVETGRFAEYERARGSTVDSQSGGMMTDAELGVLAQAMKGEAALRRRGVALTDAACTMSAWLKVSLKRTMTTYSRKTKETLEVAEPAKPAVWPIVIEGLPVKGPARAVAMADLLRVLEAGVRAHPGLRRAWNDLVSVATAGSMTMEQKTHWGGLVDELCGRSYPDFAVRVLLPMVRTVADVGTRDELFAAMERTFSGRTDLVAEIRMTQVRDALEAKDKAKADRLLVGIIDGDLNAGPFVIEALLERWNLLRTVRGSKDTMVEMMRVAFNRVRPPRKTAFTQYSNWARIGMMYADALQKTGRPDEAAAVIQRVATGH